MDDIYGLIGLIYRARKLFIEEEVYKHFANVKFLLITSDISYKSKERILKKAHYYDIDYLDDVDGMKLSNALGKSNIKIVGITSDGFKETMLKKQK